MRVAPDRQNESAALASLYALKVLDSAPEPEFDAVVRAASTLCGAPISLIGLIDRDRQWIKASVGLPGVTEAPRRLAFCAYTVLGDDLFEVPDATKDPRFADNPSVTGQPGIRFYCGAPLRLKDGMCVGALCVVDREPRRLSEVQRETLRSLSRTVAHALEGRRAIRETMELAAELSEQHELLRVTLQSMADDQHRSMEQVAYRATHDTLTGLKNRVEFEAQLGHALQTARDERRSHALMYIDLDRFKLVNDACGHSSGDELLRQFARVMAGAVRACDTMARLGGDEFAAILEDCTMDEASSLAQTICDRMDDFRFVQGELKFRVGASIGLVRIDHRWRTEAEVLQAADASCFAAKEAGRNRVHLWFDTDLAVQARQEGWRWVTQIEQALDEERFELFAQRIVPLGRKATGVHAEVLLRMVTRDGALVPPNAFLPAAERFNLASRIDRWVLCRALLWLRNVPDLSRIENLSVNLSGQSVGDPDFHAWARGKLDKAGSALCAKLCLEITETSAVANLADAAVFIDDLRRRGVRVALDDFGSGASSFGYLKKLSLDFLKIDGQFVRQLLTDALDEAAVRCFVNVAKVVGMKTVAEFVESPAVLARLERMGVDFVQGFHVHRPAPIDELLEDFPDRWPPEACCPSMRTDLA